MLEAIAHPTDFSSEGLPAFHHALALALANRCRLDLIHVAREGERGGWQDFPQVRATLEAWGRIAPGSASEEVLGQTGVSVRKVGIHETDAAQGLADYLKGHRPSLVVMASHGRAGLERLLAGSVSSQLVQATGIPALLLGPEAQGFVDPATGAVALTRVLVPVDHDPAPETALDALDAFNAAHSAALDAVHVGKDAPQIPHLPVRELAGAVVETILGAAAGAQLIAMPMRGRHGLLDALRGSTTERVLAEASVPVLALPVRG
jgi:nucleotide-binding universal stress UspA family protein